MAEKRSTWATYRNLPCKAMARYLGIFHPKRPKEKERLVLWYARTCGVREGPCGVRPRSRPRFGRASATEPDLFEIEYIVSNDGGQQ